MLSLTEAISKIIRIVSGETEQVVERTLVVSTDLYGNYSMTGAEITYTSVDGTTSVTTIPSEGFGTDHRVTFNTGDILTEVHLSGANNGAVPSNLTMQLFMTNGSALMRKAVITSNTEAWDVVVSFAGSVDLSQTTRLQWSTT